MSLDLAGIQNVGEFYSHHYLDALLDNDLKGLFASWHEQDSANPNKQFAHYVTDIFKTNHITPNTFTRNDYPNLGLNKTARSTNEPSLILELVLLA